MSGGRLGTRVNSAAPHSAAVARPAGVVPQTVVEREWQVPPRSLRHQDSHRLESEAERASTCALRFLPATTVASCPDGGENRIRGGRPLSQSARADLEARLGADFAGVRVHTDTGAAEAAEAIGARAFTVKNSIVFAAGEYAPGSDRGRRLLAHELVHVRQQTGARSSGNRRLQQVYEHLGNISPADVQVQCQGRQPRDVSAVVTVRWSFDDGEFYRRLVAAVARSRGFRGVGQSALWQPLHGPTMRFHTRHSQANSRGLDEGDRVRVRVTAGHDPRSHGGSVYNATVESDSRTASPQSTTPQTTATATLTPEQAATPAGVWAKTLIGFLRVSAGSKILASFYISSSEIKFLNWEARGEDPGDSGRSAPVGRLPLTVAEFLELARGQNPVIFELELELSEGEWELTRWQKLAEIRPTPQAPQGGSYGAREPDEAERIIQDIRGTRQMVLDTAAVLIAEHDPRRLENIVTAVGPFAIAKVARLGKLARTRRLASVRELLRRMRVPRAVPLRGNASNLDPKLLELARDVRATQAGVTRQNFSQLNVATARVRVDGKVRYLDSGNLRGGPHSEEWIHSQITQLSSKHREVRLEQLYSERIPCSGTCGPLLTREHSAAEIFFSTRKSGNAAAKELMQNYGL